MINQRGYKFYVVDINKIFIDSGWEYREDAIDRAAELREEGGVPKVCNKSRVAVGNRVLDPDDDASWSPSRNAEAPTGVRGVHRNPDGGQPRYREAFGHARDAGRHAVSAYRAARGRPQQNPRLNPAPERQANRDEERGAKVFEMWHQKEPTGAQVKRVLSDMDQIMVPVGKAHEIVYRSGKWEKGRKTNDYVHAFDSHPTVYMLEKFAPESQAAGKAASSLLRAAQGADGRFVVAELAVPLTLSINGGDEIDIHNGSKVYGAVDKHTVLICDPHWKLIVIRGGRMHFDERGIVY